MTLSEKKNRIYDRLKNTMSIPVKKDIKGLLGEPIAHICIIFSNEVTETNPNVPYLSVLSTSTFSVIIDSRSLLTDEKSLDYINEIIKSLHGLSMSGGNKERLFYVRTKFQEFIEGSGIWTHILDFECRDIINPIVETLEV